MEENFNNQQETASADCGFAEDVTASGASEVKTATGNGANQDKATISQKPLRDKKSRDERAIQSIKGSKKKHNYWALIITCVSFFLAAFFSFLSNLASNAHIVVMVLLLVFLILANIVTDGIGVAVTSCELAPLSSMASRKVYGAKTAIKLVKNAEKVANICCDVIGDIFGIITGTCMVVIVLQLVAVASSLSEQLWSIIISSFVGALIIGGKAYVKMIAINNSKSFVMFIARLIAVFDKDERKHRGKKQRSNK